MKKVWHTIKTAGKNPVKTFKKSGGKSKVFIAIFAVIGITALLISRAATFSVSVEPETGSLAGCASKTTDSSASNNSAVKFCSVGAPSGAGAHLPITYSASSLSGTVRYVDTNGSDSNSGSSSSPYATLAKAVSASAANDTIVVNGGTYRNQRNVTVNKAGLRIIAASGQTPIFNGAQPVSNSSGWTTEGSYKYRSYTPRPLTQTQGVAFDSESSMTNLVDDGSGRYADQLWVGSAPMDQVTAKTSLSDGKFFVDRANNNNRLYMTANDSAKSGIESSVSSTGSDRLFEVTANGVTIEGLTITRYSPLASDSGVISDASGGTNLTLRNLDISWLPFEGVHSAQDGLTMQDVTMTNIAWQTINVTLADNFTLDAAKITYTDPFNEFNTSPASGALKTSRNRNTTVKNSVISNNNSHGLWFDQSNINTTVANTSIVDNTGAGVFFEISDGLTFVNNYAKASGGAQPVKAVGSSGLVFVNNTFVGGIDPLGVYTDPRSVPGCSTRTKTTGFCQISSDVQSRFPIPSTMDWMPRIDVMLNNIIAYPTNSQYCAVQPFCVNTYHPDVPAKAPINTIIHKADTSRGIPQTVIDGNVYVAGSSGVLIRRGNNDNISYTSLSAWTAAMAASPVSIAGIDANSKSGASWVNADGSPTSTLAAAHSQAVAVPTNAAINKYIPAGTKHYGVLNK